MNRAFLLAGAVALSFTLAACNKTNTPTPKVGDAPGTTIAREAQVPSAPTDRDSPPAPTPSTHSGTPQSEAAAAPTARDTSANQPMGDLTKPKGNASLPLAGQVNNHSSTALDDANKTAPPADADSTKR